MLYRLDLATSYPSIPALIQHFMDETALDGVVEVKMVASPPLSAPKTSRGKRSTKPPPPPPPPLQPTTSVISFRREGREVNAIALFGPASAPASILAPDERGDSYRGIDAVLAGHGRPGMVVKKRYPPRTTLVWVFAPLVQKLLDEGADTVLFEVRSYIAGTDSVRESQSAPSPISPYGTSHSACAASPSVLASGSTPSSGGAGSAFGDFPTGQYAPSSSHPVAETKAPILTELHRRPRDLRTEATSYEAPRPTHLRSPVQRHVSMPMPFRSNAPPASWSYPQSNQWDSTSGYHDLQSLPPPPTWESSFSSEGWGEHVHPAWQPEPAAEPYAYPAIPPLPWQPLDPSYASSALDPVLSQAYLETLTPQSFSDTYYTPDTSFSGQADFSVSPQDVTESHVGGVPATFQSPTGMVSQPVEQAVNWQTQYPYLGALDIPPVDAFSYSHVQRSHSEGRETGTSESNRPPDPGSPNSPPPPSSDRDSLTPTLTNPGYNRASATPHQQWPFVRGSQNQPTPPVSSAYTPPSHSLGAPGPPTFRSFSDALPRSRIRLRSTSPEPTAESPRRGAKRLKVSAGSRVLSLSSSAASPPPLSAVSSSSQPRSIKSHVSSTVASGSGAQHSLRTVSPSDHSPAQDQQELDNALLEVLTRPAPYRRMLGYAARQQDGSVVAYELSDSVAATTGDDTLLGLGLSNVTNVAALGMELGRRAAVRGSPRGAGPTPNANLHGEHGDPRQPRGGDGWRSHIRGASVRPGWQGCVVA
jgi:hypothetical protein